MVEEEEEVLAPGQVKQEEEHELEQSSGPPD